VYLGLPDGNHLESFRYRSGNELEERKNAVKGTAKTVVAGALGECVHVAGVTNFLRLAESAGWRTVFLGPAVSIGDVLSSSMAPVKLLMRRGKSSKR
jgi:hypothetical protein